MPESSAIVPDPLLSVIMPARNAASYLPITLPAIMRNAPSAMQVIVVDDASSDDTALIAEAAGATVLRLKQRLGPAGARNAGASASCGKILVFIDADVEVHDDTLASLAEALETDPDLAAVFGSYDDNPADPHLVSVFKNLLHYHIHQEGGRDAETFWTGCGAVRRDVFIKVGPFRDAGICLMEDVDYGHRLRDAGYRIELRPQIQCRHLKRWKLGPLIKTDVFQRGIPWTVMMLRRRRRDSQLNLSARNGGSTLAGGTGLVAWVVALWLGIGGGSAAWVVATFAVGLFAIAASVLLQRKFYGLLAQKRGGWFAVRCVPMHLIYYAYSILSLATGAAIGIICLSGYSLKRRL